MTVPAIPDQRSAAMIASASLVGSGRATACDWDEQLQLMELSRPRRQDMRSAARFMRGGKQGDAGGMAAKRKELA